jgi:hypothetical protein
MSSTKYAYKVLNTFDPVYYRQWASTVRDAFAERDWTHYLEPPTSESKDPETSTHDATEPFRAKAFLSQSIPLEHKASIEECKTAADIWLVFRQRYGSRTREDELRLEQEVLDTVKIATDSIDQHIQKFHNMIAALRAQQEPNQRYDDSKVNMTFLRSLERAQIPDEDWMGFVAYLGKTWLTITPDTLYSEARTYYRTHLAHRKPSTPAATSPDERVLTTFAPPFTPQSPQSGQRGRGRGRNRGRGNGNNSQRPRPPPNLPRDPNAWCTHCEIPGHSLAMCWKKTQTGQQSSGQQSAPYEGNSKPSAPTGTPSRGLTIRALENKTNRNHRHAWTYDSACTEHLTGKPSHFTTYDDFQNPIPIYGIGINVVYAYGHGIVTLQNSLGNTHRFNEVWWVPALKDSIISKARTKRDGLITTMSPDERITLHSVDSNFSITSTEVDAMTLFTNVSAVELYPDSSVSTQTSTHDDSASLDIVLKINIPSSQLDHERLGHASTARLRLVGISYTSGNCHECRLGKQTRLPFPRQITITVTLKLERVYSDLCPVTPISFGLAKYFITFIDELTRYCWIYLLPDKSSATILRILQIWSALVQNQSGTEVQHLRTDQGSEYTGETLKTVTTFLQDKGITHETTSAHSSSSNGIAERMNRTLMNMVRPMLLKSKVPSPFWAEALNTATKIRNRLPTSSLPDNISPHQAWFGTVPSIKHFRQFGCIAYVTIYKPKHKVDARAIQGCLLGYKGTSQYRVYLPDTQKVVTSKHVTFMENQFLDPIVFSGIPYADRPLLVPEKHTSMELDDDDDTENEDEEDLPESTPLPPMPQYLPVRSEEPSQQPHAGQQPLWPIPPLTIPAPEDDGPPSEPLPRSPIPRVSPPAIIEQPTIVELPPQPPPPRRSERLHKPSDKKVQSDAGAKLAFALATYIPSFAPPVVPRTVKEALSSPYAAQWTTAINNELTSLDKNGTFQIVPRPSHQHAVGSKFVFTIKDAEGASPRFKTRFVGKGYTQVPGVDYDDTFAPVIKATSTRVLFSQAASDGHLLNAFDVETAYLNSTMDRELYVELPETFSDSRYPRRDFVLQALKSLYGFKQSAYLWSNDIKEKLLALGFIQSDADEGVFLSANKHITVALYVDDGLIKAEHQQEIDWVITQLSNHYTIRNLGAPKKFLGLNIHRPDPRGSITISQGTYARKLLAKFDMETCHSVKAPCDGNASALHALTDEETPASDPELYRSITSSIMHLAVWTRPDISYIVNKLCQYNHNPSEIHSKSAKHLLRYIAGTLDYGITYSHKEGNALYGMFMDYNDYGQSTPLYGYSDASGASDPDDRCSTSGYVFFYNNGAVIWASRKQKYTVALSSMESEYVALTEAAKEAAFLRKLLKSLDLAQTAPTLILTDSESALRNIKNNINHTRAKHIDTRHHYIRMAYNAGEVDIRHIPSVSQTADILTKPLGILKHAEAVKLLMLQDTRYI